MKSSHAKAAKRHIRQSIIWSSNTIASNLLNLGLRPLHEMPKCMKEELDERRLAYLKLQDFFTLLNAVYLIFYDNDIIFKKKKMMKSDWRLF